MSAIATSAPATSATGAGRSLPLDVLRGIAILLVLCHHCVIPTSESGALAPVARLVQRIGWTGVDLFFVLSGFLIGGLLFDEIGKRGHLDARRFLLRRLLKIWPPYFALLAYVFVFSSFIRRKNGSPADVARQLVPNLLHVQNYFTTLRAHTWSLAVEEHFYLLLPLLLLFIGRRNLRAFPVVAALAIVACTGWRVLSVVKGWTTSTYFETQYRIDGLLFGVLIAYVSRHHAAFMPWATRHRRWLLALAVLLLSPMLLVEKERPFVQSIGFSLCYLGFGCLLIAVVTSRGWHHVGAKAIGFVGLYSYSIYLWFEDLARTPVGMMVNRGWLVWLPREVRWLVAQLLYFMLAVMMGFVMSLLIERPMLRLRDRFFAGRSPAVKVSSAAAQ